jgi:flagellar motor switch protein FliM
MERYDFTRPGRLADDLEKRLGAWLRGACALAGRHWNKVLPSEVTVSLRRAEPLRTADALALLADTMVAYRAGLRGETPVTLLALPRPLVLALVAGLLGDPRLLALPDDRSLTPIEEWLWQDFLSRHWLPVLTETWPGPEPAAPGVLRKEPHARYSRAFTGEEKLVVCSLLWRGPFEEQEGYWLLPLRGLAEELGLPKQAAVPEAAGAAVVRRLEGLVRELPVEVQVILGAARVQLPELAQLRPGDLVLLDQHVSEPLQVLVGGQKKFLGWPGQVAGWQALQIECLSEG